jgi:hypothetical protein
MTRFLRLNAACPSCGWTPGKRITEAHAEALRTLDPGEVVDSLKCQNTRCKAIYEVTAAAYHGAEAA